MDEITGTTRLARLAPVGLIVGIMLVPGAHADAPESAASSGLSAAAAAQGCAGRGAEHANGRIVVRAGRSLGYPTPGEKLFTVRPDGTGRRALTSPAGRESDLTVEPAPDGRRVAIARYRRGSFMKIVRLATGRTTSLLPAARVIPTAPVAWSPDGKLLAFTANPDTAVPALRLVRPDGSSPRDLAGGVTHARWSRNGRCLVGFKDGGIGVASAAGATLHAFSSPFRYVFGLTFSPDGRRLIFHAAGESPTDDAAIYSSDLDGTDRRTLVAGTRIATDPVIVSPDGRWLAYSDRRGTLARRLDGGPARRLLKGLYIMAWAPAPSR